MSGSGLAAGELEGGPGQRQAGSGLSDSRLQVSTFWDCMMACDNYNIVNFKSGTPCRGVSFKPGNDSPNCFLKASIGMPRYAAEFDSAKLITLDPPANNNTETTSK